MVVRSWVSSAKKGEMIELKSTILILVKKNSKFWVWRGVQPVAGVGARPTTARPV